MPQRTLFLQPDYFQKKRQKLSIVKINFIVIAALMFTKAILSRGFSRSIVRKISIELGLGMGLKPLLQLQKSVKSVYYIHHLAMFGSSTESSPRNHHPSSDNCLPAPQFDSFDIQYEICSKFIKMASQQLYQKELQLINSTSTFIEKVQDSITAKDFSCTHETLSTFDTFCDDDDAFSQPSRSRLLLRKSGSNGSLRRTESGLNDALREVQKRCSEKTSSMLSNLAGEFRKMKQKLASSEKFEKELKRLELRFNSSEEELLVARKRVSDLEKENKNHSEELHSLRKRLKEATEQAKSNSLILSKSSDNLKPLFAPGPTDKMRRFLQQKEVHIFKKQKQIRAIQDRIQSNLEASVENGCEKCCLMMKRIKDSIMKYRVFLQEQAGAAEQCYNNFKRHFY